VSQGGVTISPRRHRLSPAISEMLICLRSIAPLLRKGESCADMAKRLLF
jgi:hypothetical protein